MVAKMLKKILCVYEMQKVMRFSHESATRTYCHFIPTNKYTVNLFNIHFNILECTFSSVQAFGPNFSMDVSCNSRMLYALTISSAVFILGEH
jgi:hypothetical protein